MRQLGLWINKRKTTLRMFVNLILLILTKVLSAVVPDRRFVERRLRPFLHRLRGVKIYGNVAIGDDVYLEEIYSHCVEIHDGVVIAARCTIIASMKGPGKIIIRKDAAIGAGCVIVCASGQTLTIGEGAVIAAGSTVSHDIPPYTLCGAPRIKAFGKVTVPLTMDQEYEKFRRGLKPMRPTITQEESS